MENKDPNILSYEELTTVLHSKMEELIAAIEHSNKLQTKFNTALEAMLSIKQAYPHIFEECVTQKTMDKICGREE